MRSFCLLSDADIQKAFKRRFNIDVSIDELIFSHSSIEEIISAQSLYLDPGKITSKDDQAIEITGIKSIHDGPTQTLRCIFRDGLAMVFIS